MQDEQTEYTFLVGEPMTVDEFLAKRRERQLRLVEDVREDDEQEAADEEDGKVPHTHIEDYEPPENERWGVVFGPLMRPPVEEDSPVECSEREDD